MLNILVILLVIAGLLAAGAVIFYAGSYLVLYLVGILFPLRPKPDLKVGPTTDHVDAEPR